MDQILTRIAKRKRRRPFKLLQIESTLECSLDCVMCPWSELRPPNANMSWETFAQIEPYLQQTESVDLTGGGEPFKNPLLLQMVRAAKQAGCEVGFSTNATRMTPEVSGELIEAGLDWISFSVDAASAELYERIRRGASFQKVIENIEALHELKRSRKLDKPRMLMVFVMMTGEQENFPELPAFIELAQRLGVEQVIAKHLDVILKDGDDQRRLFSHTGGVSSEFMATITTAELRARELGVGLRFYHMQPQEVTICEHNPLQSVFINWQGFVSPCITLSYAENRVFDGQRIVVPCQRFGDIGGEKLLDIWEKPAYREFRSYYEKRLQVEQQVTIDHLLGGPAQSAIALPPAPEGCRTCYYLYGI